MRVYLQSNPHSCCGIVDVEQSTQFTCSLCGGEFPLLQGTLTPGFIGQEIMQANYALVSQPSSVPLTLCRNCTFWLMQYTLHASPLGSHLDLLYLRSAGRESTVLTTWFEDALMGASGTLLPDGTADMLATHPAYGRWRCLRGPSDERRACMCIRVHGKTT
jgi:hypothetical protein